MSLSNETMVNLREFYWTFVLPLVSFGVFILNLINTIVLLKITTKNLLYKYMLSNSYANLAYSFICSFVFLMRCGKYCTISEAFLTKVYELYFFIYFSSVLAIFNILIEIIIAYYRYSIVANKSISRFASIKKILIILFALSAIYYLPFTIWRKISKKEVISLNSHSNHTVLYYGDSLDGALAESQKTKIVYYLDEDFKSLNYLYKGFLYFHVLLRSLIVLLCLFFVNIITFAKFNQLISKRKLLLNLSQNNCNLIFLLVLINLMIFNSF